MKLTYKQVKATSIKAGEQISLQLMWNGSYETFQLEVVEVVKWVEDGTTIVSVQLKNRDGHKIVREWWGSQTVNKVVWSK